MSRFPSTLCGSIRIPLCYGNECLRTLWQCLNIFFSFCYWFIVHSKNTLEQNICFGVGKERWKIYLLYLSHCQTQIWTQASKVQKPKQNETKLYTPFPPVLFLHSLYWYSALCLQQHNPLFFNIFPASGYIDKNLISCSQVFEFPLHIFILCNFYCGTISNLHIILP